LNKSLLRNSAASLATLSAFLVMPALAQVDASGLSDDNDVIVVTGSRIARPELDVASPIVSVSAAMIENTGQNNIADILIRNPALTASTGASLSGGADAGFGGTGVNLLNLRNLGIDRTLVLVNGKRHIAGTANSAAVDINSIPQDLIQSVDVLTGGASAIYGADGVSGVVNFVLKRDFEGLTGRAQAGISSKGDAASQRFSILGGKNFADGRGNVTLSYEFTNADRLHSSRRARTGNPAHFYGLVQNPDDFDVDDPNVYDRILQNNLTWAYSARPGMVFLDSGMFLGDGSPYDPGIELPGTPYAIGGTNTPVAGYYGDIVPSAQNHNLNALASYEFSPAARLYVEGKFVNSKAYSVGQPSFDFGTELLGDNAYLIERFGAADAAGGAGLYRDNFDLGIRGETNIRKTYRAVIGMEGQISDNLRYDLSYVYGRMDAKFRQTSNLIGDRFFAALDAVTDPESGQIVCRTTLDPTASIPDFAGRPTTFTPGAGSICRPLNLLGEGVASQEALDFVLAENVSKSRLTQHVVGGYISGNTDGFINLPGGAVEFAVGAEYRQEKSSNTPDLLIQNGEFRDFAAVAPSSGKFDVKEVYAELNLPILTDVRFAERLSVGGAVRLSDYSTVGTTTTWKVEGLYAPVQDIRFRATYSQAVRAPNIGELFLPSTGTFAFITDPCDITERTSGTQYRAANCQALLSGLGLSQTEIDTFSPKGDPSTTTSRRGQLAGNANLNEEKAKTWTAGVVLQPRFIPGLTVTFDWYSIKITDAVNTPSANELADLCVDQPDLNNSYCGNLFRDPETGFFLGDGGDPLQRIAFIVGPANVAAFTTAGADFSVSYNLPLSDKLGRVRFDLTGGYLDKIDFVPTIGADVDNDVLEAYNPRWRGSASLNWRLNNIALNYGVNYWSKTRRYTTEQLAGQPDIADPKYFFVKRKMEHDVRASLDVEEKFTFYAGVNNLFNEKPDLSSMSYPVSAVGRSIYAGVKFGL
jgi:iron complex outermembrane receptor protein